MPYVRHGSRKQGQLPDTQGHTTRLGALSAVDGAFAARLVQLEEHRALHPYRRRPVTLPKLKWMEPR